MRRPSIIPQGVEGGQKEKKRFAGECDEAGAEAAMREHMLAAHQLRLGVEVA